MVQYFVFTFAMYVNEIIYFKNKLEYKLFRLIQQFLSNHSDLFILKKYTIKNYRCRVFQLLSNNPVNKEIIGNSAGLKSS